MYSNGYRNYVIFIHKFIFFCVIFVISFNKFVLRIQGDILVLRKSTIQDLVNKVSEIRLP